MGNSNLEQAARKQGRIALILDQEATGFYIQLLHDYNAGRNLQDVAAFNDENYLRQEYELVYGENTE